MADTKDAPKEETPLTNEQINKLVADNIKEAAASLNEKITHFNQLLADNIKEAVAPLNDRIDTLESLIESTDKKVEEASPVKKEKKKLPSFSEGKKIIQARTFKFNVPSNEGASTIDLTSMSATDLKAVYEKYPTMFIEQ